jgi:hypothetical protein
MMFMSEILNAGHLAQSKRALATGARPAPQKSFGNGAYIGENAGIVDSLSESARRLRGKALWPFWRRLQLTDRLWNT